MLTLLAAGSHTYGQQIDSVHVFRDIPEGNQLRSMRGAVREAVASASRAPRAAFQRCSSAEANSVSFGSLADTDGFATLDVKPASALRKVTAGARARSRGR